MLLVKINPGLLECPYPVMELFRLPGVVRVLLIEVQVPLSEACQLFHQFSALLAINEVGVHLQQVVDIDRVSL